MAATRSSDIHGSAANRIRHFFSYDRTLASFETPNGIMTLPKIFIPFFIEMFLLNTMGTINTLMLSRYSDEAVAAVGAATQVTSMILTLYTVIGSGASIVINHNLGAGRREAASNAAFSSLVFCGGLSLLTGAVLSAFAGPLLSLMHLEDRVLAYAVTYFKTVIRFSFFSAVISSISGILRSYGKPRVAVCISLTRNVLVAFFDYLVIFRPVELPLSGVSGIAVCYVVSDGLGLLLAVILLHKASLGLSLRKKRLRDLRTIRTILKVGVPGGISTVSYNVSQVVTTSVIAILGTAAISTKIYVSNIVFYVYVFGLSLGMSTSLFVGWLSGAREYERAYRLNLQNLKLTITANILLSSLVFLFALPLLSLFTDDPQILSMGRTLMGIDILVEIGRGFNHIEENSLKGAGDVLYPMGVAMISCWTMSVFFSWLLGIRLGWGLPGCWAAFAMDEFFRGTAYFLRWRSRRWMTKTVSEG